MTPRQRAFQRDACILDLNYIHEYYSLSSKYYSHWNANESDAILKYDHTFVLSINAGATSKLGVRVVYPSMTCQKYSVAEYRKPEKYTTYLPVLVSCFSRIRLIDYINAYT